MLQPYFFVVPWPGLCWPKEDVKAEEDTGAATFFAAFGFFFSRVLLF
ncbi:MAG: hypothetical protein ACHQAY_17710 [Hyphomicrobiales bacterium]